MTISYTTDLSGFYFTSITNDEATVQLTEHALAIFHTRNVTADTYAAEPVDTPGVTVLGLVTDPDGSTHVDIGSSAGGAAAYTMTLHTVLDAATGSIKFRPEFLMGASLKADYSWYGTSMEWVLPPIGNASDCMVILPSTMGISVPLQDDIVLPEDIEVKWSYPGLQHKGTGAGATTTVHPQGDFSSNVASFFPVVAIYNKVTGVGCAFRLSGNNTDRACIIALTRFTGDGLRVAYRMIPKDHAVGVNGASDEDMDYSVQVRPFLSPTPNRAWYDVVKFHDDQLVLEGHPSKTVDRIVDRPSSGAGYYPDRIRNLAAFAAMTQGDLTDANFDFTDYTTNTANIVSGFQDLEASGLLQMGYNLTVGNLWADHPYMNWAPGAAAAMQAIFGTGVQTGIYTVQAYSVADLASSGLDLEDNVVLDQDQDPLTTIIGTSTVQYNSINWINPTNVAAAFDFRVSEITSDIGTDFSVIYMDGFNALAGRPDQNSALTPAQRGSGTNAYQPGVRASMDAMRVSVEGGGVTAPGVFTEHPSPVTVGVSHLCFNNMIGPGSSFSGDANWDYVTPRFPSFPILYSDRMTITDFESFGDGPTAAFDGLDIPTIASKVERFCALYAFNFHNHQLPSFLRYFEVADSIYFPAGADAEYAEWADFLNTMFFKYGDAVRHWNKCRKVRDLDNSQHVRGIEAWATQSFTPVLVPEAKLQHSVLYDDDSDELVVRITNTSLTGHNPSTITLGETLTVAGWPDLGAGARDVYLWNWRDGTKGTIQARAASSSYTFDLPIGPGFVGVVMLVPQGATPSFIGEAVTRELTASSNAAIQLRADA